MSKRCDDCGVSGECQCYGPGKDKILQQEELIDSLSPVVLMVCEPCRKGAGGECHTPGCAFWMEAAPEFKIAGTLTRRELIKAASEKLHNEEIVAEKALLAAGVIPYVNEDESDDLRRSIKEGRGPGGQAGLVADPDREWGDPV